MGPFLTVLRFGNNTVLQASSHMHVHVYTYIDICIYLFVHIYIHMYIHVCKKCKYKNVYIHTCNYIHIYIYICVAFIGDPPKPKNFIGVCEQRMAWSGTSRFCRTASALSNGLRCFLVLPAPQPLSLFARRPTFIMTAAQVNSRIAVQSPPTIILDGGCLRI